MKNTKYLSSTILIIALLFIQVGSVFAAPSPQEGAFTGTVTGLSCQVNEDGTTTIVVTAEAEDGTVETFGLDPATAESQGLVTLDTNGDPDCSDSALNEALASSPSVEVDLSTTLPVEEPEEDAQHPVAAVLSFFFSDYASYDDIMGVHEDGAGFGVIAQALWMTTKMEGDSTTFQAIIEAKQTGDYSAFVLEDGTTPTNWGQFKKAVMGNDKKGNLGVVMSGKGNDDSQNTNNGLGPNNQHSNNGNGKGNGKGKGKGKGHNK